MSLGKRENSLFSSAYTVQEFNSLLSTSLSPADQPVLLVIKQQFKGTHPIKLVIRMFQESMVKGLKPIWKKMETLLSIQDKLLKNSDVQAN